MKCACQCETLAAKEKKPALCDRVFSRNPFACNASGSGYTIAPTLATECLLSRKAIRIGGTMKPTKYALAVTLGLIAFMAPGTARADSIVYDASGTFSGTATFLTGMVVFDSTTGLVTSASLLTTGSVPLGPLTLVLIQNPVQGNPSLDTVGIFDSSVDDGVRLVFPWLCLSGIRDWALL